VLELARFRSVFASKLDPLEVSKSVDPIPIAVRNWRNLLFFRFLGEHVKQPDCQRAVVKQPNIPIPLFRKDRPRTFIRGPLFPLPSPTAIVARWDGSDSFGSEVGKCLTDRTNAACNVLYSL
jgi:hypothetical protein